MTEKEKIAHAILTDDMDGNLFKSDYEIYKCKKCNRDYIIALEDDICPNCHKKSFFRKIYEKMIGGR